MSELLTRDGHLSEVTLNRYLQGELDGVESLTVHLDTCVACREAVSAARAFDGQVSLAPPRATAQGRATAPWPLYFGAVALAAAALIFALRPDVVPDAGPVEPDVFRLKGGFDFQVFAYDGARSRTVDSGAVVYAGERLGFKAGTRTGGHLLVLGVDGQGEPYLCYPQDGGGTSRPLSPNADAQDLQQAVRLDDVVGSEDIIALLCTSPVTFAAAAEGLRGDRRPEGAGAPWRADCRRRVIRLQKKAHKSP